VAGPAAIIGRSADSTRKYGFALSDELIGSADPSYDHGVSGFGAGRLNFIRDVIHHVLGRVGNASPLRTGGHAFVIVGLICAGGALRHGYRFRAENASAAHVALPARPGGGWPKRRTERVNFAMQHRLSLPGCDIAA
jgi:hypothetical protein